AMVDAIRAFEKKREQDPQATPSWPNDDEQKQAQTAIGRICFQPSASEEKSRAFRPSLFLVKPIKAGEPFRFKKNFDTIRPGAGLHPRYTAQVDGAIATQDYEAGTPLRWDMVLCKDPLS